ncbi:MAG TPA: hypothetical protein VGF48_25585 [Thermoanaerobaculia bacterium]|jgi:hypothetical protein
MLPLLVAVGGFLWIDGSTSHFSALTGRAFYGLAGYHYSVPEPGFEYHAAGEQIHRWTTIIPMYATAAALLLSGSLAIAVNRRRGWRAVVGVVAVHGVIAAGFGVVAAYYEINITGVFL